MKCGTYMPCTYLKSIFVLEKDKENAVPLIMLFSVSLANLHRTSQEAI